MPELILISGWMEGKQAGALFAKLQENIPWEQLDVLVYGQRFPQPRLTYYVSSQPYTYSGLTLTPTPPEPWLADILRTVDAEATLRLGLSSKFNSVLFNRYRTGADSIGWHSDNEEELGSHPVVASLSLGATRAFAYRRRGGGDSETIDLNHGDLLIMPPGFQATHQHALPKRAHASERISLTFRTVL